MVTMSISRRGFLGTVPAALAFAAKEEKVVPAYEKPLFDLHKASSSPVRIKSIELLRIGNDYFIRASSSDGVTGLCMTKQMLQWASAIPNIGPYMEYPFRAKEKKESWYTPNFFIRDGKIPVPTGPGLGVEFDRYMKKAEVVKG